MVEQDGPKRHWYQFRLRTLMVFTVAPIVLGGSWYALKASRARTQRAAVARIQELGGQVFYDVHVSELGGTKHFLKKLFGIDFIANVKGVDLVGPDIGDAEIESLKAFVHLQSLSLCSDRVTDSGLAHLPALRNLQKLDLTGTSVTDKGAAKLEKLVTLQDLDLSYTKITDSGLRHLAGLTRLKVLWLVNTQVTDAGVAELRKSLPNCRIIR